MNTSNDELESLMTIELRDRADEVGAPLLDVATVSGRARSIRRRRRIGAGLGVAAAVAVVVPLAMTASGSLDPERTMGPAGPNEVVRTTLTLDGLVRGKEPAIEYFTPDGVVLPGSGLQPLDDSWQALVPSEVDGGWLGLSPSRDEIVNLTDGFEQDFSRRVAQAMVSNPDRSQVAWTVIHDGRQILTVRSTIDPPVGQSWEFPAAPLVEPVDFVGEESLVFETIAPDGPPTLGIAHQDGTTTMFETPWVKAISATPATGLVAVQTKSNPDGSGCSGVLDPAQNTSRTVWDTCNYMLGAFSPDGRYVLASDAYQSGIGTTSLSVLDAGTGQLVASFQQEGGGRIALNNLVWESPDTVVAVALEAASTTILRLGVDGSLEETVDRVDEQTGDQSFYLSEDRRRGF